MMKNKEKQSDQRSFFCNDRPVTFGVLGSGGEKTEGSGSDATFGNIAEDFHQSKRAGGKASN